MLDLKKIRKDPELFDQLLEKRGIKPQVEKILKVDKTDHEQLGPIFNNTFEINLELQ